MLIFFVIGIQKYHDSAFYKSTLPNFINMTHQETVKDINNKLSELTRQFEKLSSSDEIHLIDIDILLEMMRELYLKTSLLKEPVKTDEIIAVPALPISTEQHDQSDSDFDFNSTSTPKFPEPELSHEAEPEAEWPEEVAAEDNTPILSQESHYEEPSQSEIESPEIETAHPHQEITQSRPEPIYPQPEIVKQESQIVQPKAEYTPRESEIIHPPAPEPMEPTPQAPPSYYSPKPPVHQPDLFGSGSLSDKYKTEAPSINDKITTGKPDHTLADKMNLVPISDIKSAIGINEKFQFINELFDGSSQQYNEAIALLNSCTGSDSAHALFHDFQLRHNWDSENKVLLKFREYMERRHLNS